MNMQDLIKKTKSELLRLAKTRKIKGCSVMDKKALASTLSAKEILKAKEATPSKTRSKIIKKPIKKTTSVIKGILTRTAAKSLKVITPKQTQTPIYTANLAQSKVEESKFFTPATQTAVSENDFQFPHSYGDNIIVLMVRDPWWVYAYWEIADQRINEVKGEISRQNLSELKSILRVYDVTGINFTGSNANNFFDIELTGMARNWYINVNNPDRSYCIDIGILTKDGKFFVLARSNVVRVPRFGMSDVLDEEWMSAEEDYWRLFGLSGGFGIGRSSMEMSQMMKKRLMEQITSGVSSISSPTKRVSAKAKSFWFWVDCELIVYGATEPDASVTVCGKPVKLRNDGTFSLRFALPDGQLGIPAEATSSDGEDRRKITPIVTRRTEK